MVSRGKRAPNHMGSIYKRRDGRYEGRISLPGGKRKSYYAGTEREVVALMQAALNEVRLGVPVPAKDQSLGNYLSDWLENTIRPNRSPSTYRNYRQMVKLYVVPALGTIRLSKLTGQDVQRFENQLRQRRVARTGQPVSERLVQLCHGVLKSSLNKAVRFGLIARNPVASVDPPRPRRKEVHPLTPDQARLLLTTVRGSSLEAYFTVAISLGLRPGEALGLQWSDINWSARTLTVRKQLQRNAEGKLTLANLKTERSRRTIHLPSVTIRALMQHRAQQLEDQQQAAQWEDNDLVFSTKGARGNTVGGRPLQQRNVYRELQGHLQMAGLPRQRLYDLRHLAASLLIAQGASLREVMEVLGHSQYTLTADTYVHIYDEMGRANADRIDQWYGDPAISSAAGEEGSSTTLEEW